MTEDTPEDSLPKETKFCPRCSLENIRTKIETSSKQYFEVRRM